MVHQDILGDLGKRLHFGDDVGCDVRGDLLDDKFLVPSFPADGAASFEEVNGCAEVEGL